MTLKCVILLTLTVTTCVLSEHISSAAGQMQSPNDEIRLSEMPSVGRTTVNHDAPYRLSGRFHLQRATNSGYLVLECELPKGSYIYSLTQKGAVKPTVIKISPSNAFATSGKFIPDRQPKIVEEDPVFQQRLEKHTGKVQFFIPMQLQSNANPETLQPELIFDGQVCSSKGVCMPIRNKMVKAKFAGYFERTAENPKSLQNSQRQ